MICDFDITAVKNFKQAKLAIKILFVILECVHPDGTVEIAPGEKPNKENFASYLGITEQTAGSYIRELANNNILKYRYEGEMMVNPEFFYTGEPEAKEAVKQNYLNFKSHV